MKIGFSGTHSTGKTTLLEALREHSAFKNYHFDVNVTRWIRELGLPINQGTSDASQEINMARRVAALHSHDKLIADRTVYDVLAYTLYANKMGSVSDESLTQQLQWFAPAVREYDHVFYIPPEIDNELDGTRSDDEDFRLAIDLILKSTYYLAIENNPKTKIHKLAGSVEQRVDQITNILAMNDWS